VSAPAGAGPELSLVVPCYDEEESIPYTLPALCAAFAKAGLALEIVAVDNGSRDRTGARLAELVARGLPVEIVRVEVNQGYGFGLLAGIPHARAPWVGFIPADGQVDAEDVVRLFQALLPCGPMTLGKVRRRFRMDGWQRKLVSIAYNGLVCCLWPRLGSIDVNGTPKILHRDVLARMGLESRRWFLDPEILIKARYMRVRVLELNAFARMRGRGLSHVRAATCWEFLRELLRYRFTGHLRPWKRALGKQARPRSLDGCGEARSTRAAE
jgi:glycosyltransferase involved in cell wall biosynthesis